MLARDNWGILQDLSIQKIKNECLLNYHIFPSYLYIFATIYSTFNMCLSFFPTYTVLLCITTVAQSLAVEQKSKPVQDFRTFVPQMPMKQVQQNVNRLGNQQQQQVRPMGEYPLGHQDMAGVGGAHHNGGGAQWSNELKSQPVRKQDSFPMGGGAQHVGGWERQRSNNSPIQQNMLPMGGAQKWPDQPPPKKQMQAWGENQRQQSNERTQSQSSVAKPEKKVVKSQRDLGKLQILSSCL